MPDPETNTATVTAYYHMMFNECRPREAIARHAGDDHIQHTPYVGDGKGMF